MDERYFIGTVSPEVIENLARASFSDLCPTEKNLSSNPGYLPFVRLRTPAQEKVGHDFRDANNRKVLFSKFGKNFDGSDRGINCNASTVHWFTPVRVWMVQLYLAYSIGTQKSNFLLITPPHTVGSIFIKEDCELLLYLPQIYRLLAPTLPQHSLPGCVVVVYQVAIPLVPKL